MRRSAGSERHRERPKAGAMELTARNAGALAAAHRGRWRYIESACGRRPARETLAAMRNEEFDFSKLSVAERIQLAEDLWDSIPESPDIALNDAQKAELDRRLEDLEQHPDAGEPWEVVRARFCGRLKRGE